MKTKFRKKAVVLAVFLCVVAAAYLWYTRPVTIRQLYPMLPFEECQYIKGDYYQYIPGTNTAVQEFTIQPDDEDFQAICDLVFDHSYRRQLRDLWPRSTRLHSPYMSDYEWELFFGFDSVPLPSGSTVSGDVLHVRCWYGDLSLGMDDLHLSKAEDQEAWRLAILELIR